MMIGICMETMEGACELAAMLEQVAIRREGMNIVVSHDVIESLNAEDICYFFLEWDESRDEIMLVARH